MKKSVLNLAAGFCVASVTALAETNGTPGTLNESKLQPWRPSSILEKDFDPFSFAVRTNYARALLRAIEPIYDAIPNLTPDQEEWLRKERERLFKADTDLKVLEKGVRDLDRSKEFALEQAKLGLAALVNNLQIYLRGGKETTSDIFLWTAAAFQLTDRDTFFYLQRLESDGVIKLPESVLKSSVNDEEQGSRFADRIGRRILEHLVLPRLAVLEGGKITKGGLVVKDGALTEPPSWTRAYWKGYSDGLATNAHPNNFEGEWADEHYRDGYWSGFLHAPGEAARANSPTTNKPAP